MLVSDVLDEIDDFYSEADDTEKLRHFQREHNRIRRIVPIATSVATFSSLLDGTKEYATGDAYMKVFSARYVRSETEGDSKVLLAISVDELDLDFADWRAAGTGEPTYWYWRSAKIGFHNTPDTSTSGSYPNVSLEVATTETVTTSTAMPAHVAHYEAWMYGTITSIAAARRDWEAVQYFRPKSQEALAELIRMHHDRTARYQPRQRASVEAYGVDRV